MVGIRLTGDPKERMPAAKSVIEKFFAESSFRETCDTLDKFYRILQLLEEQNIHDIGTAKEVLLYAETYAANVLPLKVTSNVEQ